MAGKFANGGGFARAIHPRHHDDRGFMCVQRQLALQRQQYLGEYLGQQFLDLSGLCTAIGFHAFLQGL